MAEFNVTLNASPSFESAKGWGQEYPGGAVVGPGSDNKNVLRQRVGVYAGEPLEIVAQATAVSSPTAMGRLQINWVDAHERQLGVSGMPIQLTPTTRRFEMWMSPPTGAVAGYLYVTPHGAQDVVRYTEMRLLTTACEPNTAKGSTRPGGCTRSQSRQADAAPQ
jgi:hypothetical protein